MNPIVEYFNGNFPLTISLYCILMVGIVVITTLLSKLCVVLKTKAHLSDGVVAGLLLGLITSLPELVTCITSVISTKSGAMGFGDIVGSNIFDIFVLAVCLLSCVWIFIDSKSNKINTTSLICTAAGTLFALLAMIADKYIPALVWHGFNFFSILVLASYGTSIYFMTRNAKVPTANKNEGMTEINQAKKSKLNKLKLGWVIALIAIVAIVLIATAVFLTYSSESLIYSHWSDVIGDSFGGALLLGVVTSLPEIVCCVNLCINKEYNMVIDTIVGSTTFNLSILTIANIALACLSNQSGPMYGLTTANLTQVIVCLVMCATMIVYLVLNSKTYKSKFNKKQILGINISCLTITCLAYIVFLILGFIYK